MNFMDAIEDMRGLKVSRVWRGHGSAAFVEFGELDDGVGESTLMCEWSWRIEQDKRILCGSWSDEFLWEPTFEQLVGKTLEKIVPFGTIMELVFVFNQDYRFVTFSTTDGDPQWAIRHAGNWHCIDDAELTVSAV